jgi:beta-lactamase class A
MRKRWPLGVVVGVTSTFLVAGALQVGGATALTDPTRPVSAASPATRSVPANPKVARMGVKGTVAQLVAERPAGAVSVAAIDTVTGRTYSYGASSGMVMGSVAKVLLLESYLLMEQDEGMAPEDGDTEALTAMVQYSDNDSADSVFMAVGGVTGLTDMIQRLGLTATTVPDTGEWGLGTTNAADQVQLLRHLVSSGGPLSAASRDFAVGLMSNVEADQRWGVDAAADPGTTVPIKNGWLNIDDDDGRWVLNSDGLVPVNGHVILMSVLTQHAADYDGGVSLVESLAQATAATVSPPPRPSA